MLNNLFLKLFIICFSSFSSLAFASCHIQININGFYGEPCSIQIPKDYLTHSLLTVASTKISQEGKAEFVLDISIPKKVYFKVEQRLVPFYINPDQDFVITLSAPQQLDVLLEQIRIIKIEEQKTEVFSLNKEIARLDSAMGDFYSTLPAILRSNQLPFKIDSAEVAIEALFKDQATKSSFFKGELLYKLAEIQLLKRRGHEVVYFNYYKNEDVRFNSPAYFETFSKISNAKAQDFIRLHDKELIACENEYNIFNCVNNIQDSTFPNNSFNQLMILNYLEPTNKDERFTIDFRYSYANQIAQSNLADISTVASNWLSKNKRIKPGDQAPELGFLMEAENQKIKLNNGDKYTYLVFFESNDDVFQKHLMLLEKYGKDYSRYIQFIAISMDRDEKMFLEFRETHKIKNIQFTWFKHDWNVVENYKVAGSPTYFLIQPDGRFAKVPSPNPEGISADFTEIKKMLKTGAHDGFHFIQH